MNTYRIEVMVRGLTTGVVAHVEAGNIKQARVLGKEKFGMEAALKVTCSTRIAEPFTYTSEDDGREHTARRVDWSTILD